MEQFKDKKEPHIAIKILAQLKSVGHYYFYIVLTILTVAVLNYVAYMKLGPQTSQLLIVFPFTFLSSLTAFFIMGKITYDTSSDVTNQTKILARDLTLFTQDLVVNRWEKDMMEHEELYPLYEDIFGKPSGHVKFATKKEWDKMEIMSNGKPVPYVPYKGNEKKWHWAAKFVQELVNIVRMFGLMDKFKVGNKEHLAKTTQGTFAGWNTCFRMFLVNPLIRNVWEQYKYRHVNPQFAAWVQFYCIENFDNMSHWEQHRKYWDIETKKWLNGTYTSLEKFNNKKKINLKKNNKKIEINDSWKSNNGHRRRARNM